MSEANIPQEPSAAQNAKDHAAHPAASEKDASAPRNNASTPVPIAAPTGPKCDAVPGSWRPAWADPNAKTNPRPRTLGQYLTNAWHHLGTVSQHKRLVFEACARCGIPWQGLVHDLSKFSPDEFLVGINYYQGNRSPNAAERHDKGFSRGWIHHKGRNKHHYEYWLDVIEGGDGTLYGCPIPTRYMVEMLCDRIAASKVYEKEHYTDASPLAYYNRELSSGNIEIHPDSAAFLLVLLEHLAEHGETETLHYIRKNVIEPRFLYASGVTFD